MSGFDERIRQLYEEHNRTRASIGLPPEDYLGPPPSPNHHEFDLGASLPGFDASRQPMPTPGVESVQVSLVALLKQREAAGWAHDPELWAMVEESDARGIKTYGTTLQTFNGRSFPRDAAEEALDLAKYAIGWGLEREALTAELLRYKRALREIIRSQGTVCDEFETCEHAACRSSYGAWSLADEALGHVYDDGKGLPSNVLGLDVPWQDDEKPR